MQEYSTLDSLKSRFEGVFTSNKGILLPNSNNLGILWEAIEYSTAPPSKRFMALLSYSSFLAIEENLNENIHWAASAMELFHTFTLLHDALPSLNNRETRHGMPSCHKKFGESVAILCGDLLHSLSYKSLNKIQSNSESFHKLMDRFSDMSALVIFGHMEDLLSNNKSLDWRGTRSIYEAKIASLIATALTIGSLCSSKCSEDFTDVMFSFGHDLGIAFQIKDDLSNIEHDVSNTIGSISFANNKELAEIELQILFEKCENFLSQLSDKGYRTLLLMDMINLIKAL